MPIYAYRCEQCGHSQDAIQKFSDAPLTTCPACGAEALRKQLSAPSFQLKGSGWYVTDFRDNGKAKPGKPDEAGKGDGAKDESGKVESGKTDTGKTESGKDGATADRQPAAAKSSDAAAKPAAVASTTPSAGTGTD
jgi:putative FmdB family regulatory protein